MSDKKIKVFGNFQDLYTYDRSDDVFPELSQFPDVKSDWIHSLYDDLVSKYPDYFSRQLLGYATASDGSEDASSPIYEYTLVNPSNNHMTNNEDNVLDVGKDETLTILLNAGVHGNEKQMVYSLYIFVRNLLENKTNDLLNSLTDNVTFKIVPIVNPGGFDLGSGTYHNAFDVNVNKNYSDNWENAGAGEAPYSNFENLAMGKWLEENRNAHIHLDLHNFGKKAGPNQLSYHYSHTPEVNHVYATFIRRMSTSWKDRVFREYKPNEALGYNNKTFHENPTTYREAVKVYGIQHSSLLEFIETTPEYGSHSPELMKSTVEMIVNFLRAMISRYYS